MEAKKDKSVMIDNQGREIPLKYISKYDKVRDRVARRILARFLSARKALEKLVAESLADLETAKAAAGNDYEFGEKGNYAISTFDSLIKVEVRQRYNVTLDERVVKARELMFGYAKKIAGKIAGNDGVALMEILQAAFEPNRAGALPYPKVLALLRLNITAPEWIQAKDLLTASIKPEAGKCYLNCSTRPDIQHDFRLVRIDVADCWPVKEA